MSEQTPGRIVRCAHYLCRTSLTEDEAVYCPHLLAFCPACAWEEACDECVLEPMRQRAAAAWEAAALARPIPERDQWIDVAAENRADRRAYELAQLEDREEAS